MSTRRNFLKLTTLGFFSLIVKDLFSISSQRSLHVFQPKGPIVISTWNYGIAPTNSAGKILMSHGLSIDAVETGIITAETELIDKDLSYEKIFGSDGLVKLTACIMDEKGKYGSVSSLEYIKHPISVARLVMKEMPYVILSGDASLKFAQENGFKKEKLMTAKSKNAFKEYKQHAKNSMLKRTNNSLIGMLALDELGNLSGACTSNGTIEIQGAGGSYSMIGSCLFIDNNVGGACATNLSEFVIRSNACQAIVEFMSKGVSAEESCKRAIKDILKRQPHSGNSQLGFIALRKNGETGAYSINNGFKYTLWNEEENRIIDAKYVVKIKEFYVINDDCTACGNCLDECPVSAISKGDIYKIDPELCTSCGACADVCPVMAIHPTFKRIVTE